MRKVRMRPGEDASIPNEELLKQRIYEYVDFENLPGYKQDVVEFIFKSIRSLVGKVISERSSYDEHLAGVYGVDINALFTDSNKYEYWIIDNQVNLIFTGMRAKHTFLKPRLAALYLIKHTDILEDEVDGIDFMYPDELSQIYTGLHLGIYESGSMGGCRMVCGKDYPFNRLSQLRLSTACNLSPIDFYSKEDAQKDLDKLMEKIKEDRK